MTSASVLPTVACVVTTKNEERNLQDCLQSVHRADEVVIFEAKRVTQRQVWREKVGRKEETERRL